MDVALSGGFCPSKPQFREQLTLAVENGAHHDRSALGGGAAPRRPDVGRVQVRVKAARVVVASNAADQRSLIVSRSYTDKVAKKVRARERVSSPRRGSLSVRAPPLPLPTAWRVRRLSANGNARCAEHTHLDKPAVLWQLSA